MSRQPPGRRALVVAYCFPPHAAIGTHRTLRLVTHLAANGWAVDVLTVKARSYLAGTPVDADLLGSVPAGVRVVRSGALRGLSMLGRCIEPVKRLVRGRTAATQGSTTAHAASGPGQADESGEGQARPGFKTLVEELCAMPDKEIGWLVPALVAGVRACWSRPPDVVFSSAPPWTTHVVAKVLAGTFGSRWVADFRDPWVRSPWIRYRTKTGLAWATRLEAAVVRAADAVLFTTDGARREFSEHYGESLKFRTVANGCDPGDVPSDVGPSGDKFVLLHAGTLYGGRSPVPLLRAVGRLCLGDPALAAKLKVRFLGSTGFPGVDISAVCRDLGLEDVVEFLPRVDRRRSIEEMKRASALILLQGGTAMAIPGKLYEYLAVGRPLLALCEEGEMTQLIREHRLGVIASAVDDTAIESALGQLLRTPSQDWPSASPVLFDGRLRAAEMATVLEAVLPDHPEPICAA